MTTFTTNNTAQEIMDAVDEIFKHFDADGYGEGAMYVGKDGIARGDVYDLLPVDEDDDDRFTWDNEKEGLENVCSFILEDGDDEKQICAINLTMLNEMYISMKFWKASPPVVEFLRVCTVRGLDVMMKPVNVWCVGVRVFLRGVRGSVCWPNTEGEDVIGVCVMCAAECAKCSGELREAAAVDEGEGEAKD